jgi:hypothetical protein
MEFTISPDRRTVSIALNPRQLLILYFLIENVCVEDNICDYFPGSFSEDLIDDILLFPRRLEDSLEEFCDKHLPPQGVK